MNELINQWLWKRSISLTGTPQGEPRVDFKSLSPFLEWEVTP